MHALKFTENNKSTATLSFDLASLQKWTPLTPSVVDITGLHAPERLKVETFIKGIYRKNYDAEISVSYPTLMSVRDQGGRILAAAGFRPASSGRLFLEQYTRAPAEEVLTALYGHPVARPEIAEIGNLASEGRGASIFLYAAIASYLFHRDIAYAMVTGTDQLHSRFNKMGLKPQVVCKADIASLETEQNRWGSYYSTQPRVLAGSLAASMDCLHQRLGATYEDAAHPLYPRLHHK